MTLMMPRPDIDVDGVDDGDDGDDGDTYDDDEGSSASHYL